MPKYKNKKELDNGTTVYEYSDRQVQKRHKEKARRYQKLDENISSLRDKVRSDLDSKDVVKQMTALAVAIMDETASRVGNSTSAEDGHFGTTTWRKKHVTFSSGKATIKYVGKSGVSQEKVIKDSKLIKTLKELVEDKSGDDPIFECEEDEETRCVRADDVNNYLKEFDITAKDLRGYHANQKMIDALKEVRNGKLPDDKKEREEQLKKEFKEALEKVAEDVGHEAATLKGNYLVPGMEESYLKDGTIMEKLDKKATASSVAIASRVASAYLYSYKTKL